ARHGKHCGPRPAEPRARWSAHHPTVSSRTNPPSDQPPDPASPSDPPEIAAPISSMHPGWEELPPSANIPPATAERHALRCGRTRGCPTAQAASAQESSTPNAENWAASRLEGWEPGL